MHLPSVITIDGPAGAGKSTLGELLARELGYLYFDTGVMYRALTVAAIERHVDAESAEAMGQLARAIQIKVQPATVDDGRQYTVLLDGRDITIKLRLPEVERAVSVAAKHPDVREEMRNRQREIAQTGQVVMVGRDIGNVVMPDAELKIYLEASIGERARRRTEELHARGGVADLEHVLADVERRDALDRHVMQPAPDAITINGDALSPEDEVQAVLEYIQRRAL